MFYADDAHIPSTNTVKPPAGSAEKPIVSLSRLFLFLVSVPATVRGGLVEGSEMFPNGLALNWLLANPNIVVDAAQPVPRPAKEGGSTFPGETKPHSVETFKMNPLKIFLIT